MYLTFLAFSILHYVLGFNLSENPRWTATFSTRHVGIHLFTIKKDWMIFSGVAWKGHLTDKLLFNTNNETLQPWLVNDRYKMCYSMPTYCYNGKTNIKYTHIKYTPLTTWVTCFRCVLRFFLSIITQKSWEIMSKICRKYQFPREARWLPSDTLFLRYYIKVLFCQVVKMMSWFKDL